MSEQPPPPEAPGPEGYPPPAYPPPPYPPPAYPPPPYPPAGAPGTLPGVPGGYGYPPWGFSHVAGPPGEFAAGGPELAGWWRRVGGLLIDNLLVLAVAGIVWAISRHAAYAIGVAAVADIVYLIWMIGSRGQTLGMMAVRVRLLDASTGSPVIGYSRAALRAVVALAIDLPVLLHIPFFSFFRLLNYLWPLWDARNQTWYDKAARTVPVVQ